MRSCTEPGTAPEATAGTRWEPSREEDLAGKDEKAPRYFPNWLRQRVEAIIWTVKNSSARNATAEGCPPGCGHVDRQPAGRRGRALRLLLRLLAAERGETEVRVAVVVQLWPA